MKFNEGAVQRTLAFTTRLQIPGIDADFDPSVLGDGRPISSLECSVAIRVEDATDHCGFLSFVPAPIGDKSQPQWGDRLDLDIRIPEKAFEVLWDLVGSGRDVLLGARVCGLNRKYSYGPRSAPYIWEISNNDQAHKCIEDFWCTERIGMPNPRGHRLSAARYHSGVFDAVYEAAEKEFGRHSQMCRVILNVLEQADEEAARRHLCFEDRKQFLENVVGLVRRTQAGLRKHSWQASGTEVGVLWYHREFDRDHMQGLRALDGFEIKEDEIASVVRELLEMSWLQSEELEWAIVDALVYKQAFAMGEETKIGTGSFVRGLVYDVTKGDLLRMDWRMLMISATWFLLRVSLGAGIFWYASVNFDFSRSYFSWPNSIIVGFSLLVLWSILGFPFGRGNGRQITDERNRIFMSMRLAYLMLHREGGMVSPVQINDALLTAQRRGAIWPPSALAIVNRAVCRSPYLWRI